MIEIDGIQYKDQKGIIDLKEYSQKMMQTLKDNHIPFTIHWGKNAKWNEPNLVKDMYGDRVEKWKQVRAHLLTAQIQDVFSNDFLEATKLSIPLPPGEPLIT